MVVPTVAFGVPAIAGLVQSAAGGILGQAVSSIFRERAPRLSLPSVGRSVREIVALQDRGLEPVLTKDPFSGGLVLSTADQTDVLSEILFEREQRKVFAATEEELDELRAFRQTFIDVGRERGLPDPRVAPAVGPVAAPMELKAATSNVTARLVAPGVVVRGNSTPRATSRRLMTRLSGQCAGPQTGLTRLRCGRGGLA